MRDLNFGDYINRASLYIALAAAWIAFSGSLYFSEVLHYVPCVLCWYQRILMYPLALILTVGLLRQDINLPYYVLPFSLLGQAIATYHYLLQKTNLFSSSLVCSAGTPCNVMWINWWGFVTIPFLAMVAFFVITIMSLLAMVNGLPERDERHGSPWWLIMGLIVIIIATFVLLARNQEANSLDLTIRPGGRQSTIPAPTTETDTAAASGTAHDSLADGAALYQETCAVCHGADARGLANLGISLVDSGVIDSGSNEEALALIRAGVALDDPNNTSRLVMPPSEGHPDLTDAQIVAIVEHVRTLA